MKVAFASSLGFKIGVMIISVESVTLALLGNFYVDRFCAQVDRAMLDALEKPGDLMSQGIINLNTVTDRRSFEKLVGTGLVDAMIVGANGDVFHSTNQELIGRPATNEASWNPAWLERAKRGPVVEEQRLDGDTFLTRIAAIGGESGRDPFLFSCMRVRTTAAEAEKSELKRYFLAGSIATVIATTAALLLCFRLLVIRKLARVAKVVGQVTEGDLSARVHGEPGRDELGLLHEGVDKMAETLQSTIQSLEKTVAELNAAISDRKIAEEERLHLERQILHAQKLESLGVLAGGIAHDFNNILTAILGHSDMIEMQIPPDSPVMRHLNEITKAATRAADLARQMLAYSGKGKFFITEIHLNHVVREMGQLLTVSVSKKVHLRYELAENLPVIEGDATQIGQVFMNLITNASEAIGDLVGAVTVRSGVMECDVAYLADGNPAHHPKTDPPPAAGRYVFIEVQDTGCGMSAATLERIFDPFFTTKFTGRGLGLAAVLGIVRGHHGAMKVQSAPGTGSIFRVLFPTFSRPANTKALPPAAQSPVETWRGSGLVLFVDDEEQVRRLGQAMLAELGFDVLLAADGNQALEIFARRAPEIRCVMLDLTMPGLDGQATFTELQRIRPGVPVILCSGFSEQTLVERFPVHKPAAFLSKPFTFVQLAVCLRQILASPVPR